MAVKTLPFTLIEGQLYKHGHYKGLMKCSTSYQIQMVLHEMHQGMGGGHFFVDITSTKFLLLMADFAQGCSPIIQKNFSKSTLNL